MFVLFPSITLKHRELQASNRKTTVSFSSFLRQPFSKELSAKSASVSFLPHLSPCPPFFGSPPIFHEGKTPKIPFLGLSLLLNTKETLATQARHFKIQLDKSLILLSEEVPRLWCLGLLLHGLLRLTRTVAPTPTPTSASTTRVPLLD